VTEKREELLTDPASRVLLLKSGEERNIHIRKLAKMTGVDPYRAKERAKELNKHRFITFEKGLYVDVNERNAEALKRFKHNIEHFVENNSEKLLKNNLVASKRIKERLEELKNEKNETDSVSKEKKLEKQINHIEEALDRENSLEDPGQILETSARLSKVSRLFCGSQELHSCNVERKAKCFFTIDKMFEGRIT